MWIFRLTVKGEDGYPLIRQRLKELSWEEIEALYPRPAQIRFGDWLGTPDQIYEQFINHYTFPFSLKLFQIYGLLAAPRYYTRYHYDQDAVIAEQRSGHYVSMAGFYMRHSVPRTFTGLEERLDRAAQNMGRDRRKGGGGHGDLAVRVISSMENNLGEIFDVNVPNRGAVSNLPYDSILELAAIVDKHGPHPFAVGAMPKELLGYQHSLVLAQELCIDAALSGDRNDLLKAILAHPLIHSVRAAEAAMDELLALQADWLPQFHKR